MALDTAHSNLSRFMGACNGGRLIEAANDEPHAGAVMVVPARNLNYMQLASAVTDKRRPLPACFLVDLLAIVGERPLRHICTHLVECAAKECVL